MLIYLPKNAKKPVPVFWGMNFKGNQALSEDPGVLIPEWYQPVRPRGAAKSRYPLEQILDAGYGIATMRYYEIEPDRDGEWKNSLRGVFAPEGRLKPDDWGAIAAWAWGLSRGMDVLEKKGFMGCSVCFTAERCAVQDCTSLQQRHRYPSSSSTL